MAQNADILASFLTRCAPEGYCEDTAICSRIRVPRFACAGGTALLRARRGAAAHVQVQGRQGQDLLHPDAAARNASARTRRRCRARAAVNKRTEAALTPEQLAAREEERKKQAGAGESAHGGEAQEPGAAQHLFERKGHRGRARQRALKQADEAATGNRKAHRGRAKAHARISTAEKEFYVKKPMPKKLAGRHQEQRDRHQDTRTSCWRRRRRRSATSTPSTTRTSGAIWS